MSLDLSVIITTYNSSEYLSGLLDSLTDLSDGDNPRQIIVVDNASSDDSAGIADGKKGVQVIRSPRNLGLARGNNLGAKHALGAHLLFLNPDIIVYPGALKTLHGFASNHPEASLLGPCLVDSDGAHQSTARTYPGLLDIILRRTFFGRLPRARTRIARHMFPCTSEKAVRVDWLLGAALWLTPHGRNTIGLMPETYFLYFEDVEWCWNANHSGTEVWYVPEAVLGHVCSRASAGGSPIALWYHLTSMVRFFSRHPSAIPGHIGKGKRTG